MAARAPAHRVELALIWLLTSLGAVALALAPGAARGSEPPLVPLTEQERAWLRDHPVITVAHDPDWAPVEFTDERGDHTGIAADYLRLVEQRLGVKFKRVRDLSWQEVYARLKRREIDMAPCMAQTPERTFLAFTKPYLSIPIVVATRFDVGYIGDVTALNGRKVALVKGYAIDDWVTRDLPGIDLVRVNTVQGGLSAVQSGEAFAYLDNLLIIGDYQAKLKVTNVKIAGQTPYVNAQRMAVRADWAPLAGILDKALDTISEAERSEIYRRWVPLRYEHGFDYAVLWKIVPAFGAVVLALAIWNRRLAREMAERRRAEAALRESEERLRLATGAGNQGLFDLDVRTGHATVSPEYASMLGYDPAGFRETNAAWLERLHPDDRERVTATYGDYVAGRLPVYQLEFRQRTASGGWKWILSVGKIAERDGLGRPVRMLGTHTDITERKQAEEALRQATLVVENSPVVLFRWRAAEGWPVELASRNVSQFGYTAAELTSGAIPFVTLVHPEDVARVAREVQEHGAAGTDRFRQEYRLLTRAGDVRWVDDRTLAERDAEGRVTAYQGIVIDITERKQAEEALRASLAEKTALLQEVHHRVKNNLQVVSSLLSLQAGAEKNRTAVDALRETQGRIHSMAMLHEMLYRSEALAYVDFGAYLDRLCAHLLRAIGHHGARVTLERRGDAVRLGLDQAVPCGLIVNELVTNALKHAFPEGRAGRIVVEVGRTDAHHLFLGVADDGVGLPPEAGAAGTSTLGLRLVRTLAAQIKGAVTEVPRPGASFRVAFPDDSATPP